MQSQRVPLIVLAIGLAALLPLFVQITWPFLTPFLLASILAIAMNPAKSWLSRRTHRPGLAIFLITTATVLLLAVGLVFMGFAVTQELTSAYDAISRRSFEEGGWLALVNHTSDWVLDALASRVPVNREAIRTEIYARMKALTGYLLKNVGAAVGGATSIVITGLLTAVFLYFLLRDGKDWVDRLAALIPLEPRTTANIIQKVNDSVVANVNGVLAVGAAQGFALSVGFWLVGVRSPVLWGVLGGLASVIPVVGSPLVWVPVVVGFVVLGSYWKALILGLWSALLVGSIDNLLRPIVVGAREKQHPIIIALAAIGGTYAFGTLGILLGPVVVSLIAALIEEIQKLNPLSALTESEEIQVPVKVVEGHE